MADRYFTTSETGWLQSLGPALVTERYRNCTIEATGSPGIVVLARKLGAASIHVLPPSVLYCHS